MGIFSAIVGVVVETATLPLSVAADVLTLGNAAGSEGTYVGRKLEKIKEEAEKADKGAHHE